MVVRQYIRKNHIKLVNNKYGKKYKCKLHDVVFGSGTDLISLLILVLVGATSLNTRKAVLFQIGLGKKRAAI